MTWICWVSDFYGFYHGKSPLFTTIWDNMFAFSKHRTSKCKLWVGWYTGSQTYPRVAIALDIAGLIFRAHELLVSLDKALWSPCFWLGKIDISQMLYVWNLYYVYLHLAWIYDVTVNKGFFMSNDPIWHVWYVWLNHQVQEKNSYKHPKRFTIYSSMLASFEPLLTLLMPWGFGGKSKSGKGPPTPKKSPKNTEKIWRGPRKTDHSALSLECC